MAGMPLAPSYLNNASLTLPFLNDHHSARVINENVEQMRAEVEWWRGGRVVPFHRQLLTRYQNSANMVIAVCTASYAYGCRYVFKPVSECGFEWQQRGSLHLHMLRICANSSSICPYIFIDEVACPAITDAVSGSDAQSG